MSMITRSCRRRKQELTEIEDGNTTTNLQQSSANDEGDNEQPQSSGIPKEIGHEEQNHLKEKQQQEEGQSSFSASKEGEEVITEEITNGSKFLPDDEPPMFEGSRIGVHKFCNELLSIAETYELPEKACNDVLRLVKRMAPRGTVINWPPQINDLQNRFQSTSPIETKKRREETVAVGKEGANDLAEHSFAGEDNSEYMNHIIDSLDKLSEDVNSLKRQQAKNASASAKPIIKTVPDESKPVALRKIKQENDRRRVRFYFKILNESNEIVSICDLEKDQLIRTVRICREDASTRILYKNDDITDRVLQKLDISVFLHNPSYCGRAVADTLFNPEFLSRYHILSEGQNTTRSNRELMPPELSRVFYDSLRKLGVARIVEADQIGWLEQARDAVNQRNRDIKIPGCRRKYFQNSDPIFK